MAVQLTPATDIYNSEICAGLNDLPPIYKYPFVASPSARVTACSTKEPSSCVTKDYVISLNTCVSFDLQGEGAPIGYRYCLSSAPNCCIRCPTDITLTLEEFSLFYVLYPTPIKLVKDQDLKVYKWSGSWEELQPQTDDQGNTYFKAEFPDGSFAEITPGDQTKILIYVPPLGRGYGFEPLLSYGYDPTNVTLLGIHYEMDDNYNTYPVFAFDGQTFKVNDYGVGPIALACDPICVDGSSPSTSSSTAVPTSSADSTNSTSTSSSTSSTSSSSTTVLPLVAYDYSWFFWVLLALVLAGIALLASLSRR